MAGSPEIRLPMNPFQLFPAGTKDYYHKTVLTPDIALVKAWDFTGQINKQILFMHYLNCATLGQASKRAGIQLHLFGIDAGGNITDFAGNDLAIFGSGSPTVTYSVVGSLINIQADASPGTGSGADTVFDIQTIMMSIDVPQPPPP